MFTLLLLGGAAIATLVPVCDGHGYMIDPTGRASLWRNNWDVPKNYNDNECFCGGFQHQWEVMKGKCGVCGDPYDGNRKHEAGGEYAKGIIVRNYKKGSVITVRTIVTANHFGYFEFRLCPVNNKRKRATQSCLDKHLLKVVNGNGTRHYVKTRRVGEYVSKVQLPRNLECSQCMLQWKYHAGNSWGNDFVTGKGCIGCGPQEEFYACADVKISKRGGTIVHPTKAPIVTLKPIDPKAQVKRCRGGKYKAGGHYINKSKTIDPWCMTMCNVAGPDRNCPQTHCQCA
ncbi:hypothetical protein NP493_667g01018 [Ridgeia piscesae]|uniref:Chitin-binding type-4 domain-containing protein n=1 Tax=Ridgeia piscesae TaxID=27915 RepID=A0AAD9KRK8_RIDPI|nr:hypothetical protein NP493_667g01018 [Ridgeia piscesae]